MACFTHFSPYEPFLTSYGITWHDAPFTCGTFASYKLESSFSRRIQSPYFCTKIRYQAYDWPGNSFGILCVVVHKGRSISRFYVSDAWEQNHTNRYSFSIQSASDGSDWTAGTGFCRCWGFVLRHVRCHNLLIPPGRAFSHRHNNRAQWGLYSPNNIS